MLEYDELSIEELKKDVCDYHELDEEEAVKLGLWYLRNETDTPDNPDRIISREQMWKIISVGARSNISSLFIDALQENKEWGLITLGKEYQRVREKKEELWDDILLLRGLDKEKRWKIEPTKGEIVEMDEQSNEGPEDMVHYG